LVETKCVVTPCGGGGGQRETVDGYLDCRKIKREFILLSS
jgi:hypothetical protein